MPLDVDELRTHVHDLANKIGVILNSVELMRMDSLPPNAATRARVIEEKAVQARDLLKKISRLYSADA